MEKSVRNFNFLMISQVFTILLAFMTRTFLVRFLGIEAVAINSLFTQVITAIIYNLYKPLAEGDRQKVSELMSLFRTSYRIIGLATLLSGVGLAP